MEDTNYLSITVPKPSMKKGYYADAVAFWNGVIPTLQTKNSACQLVTKKVFVVSTLVLIAHLFI